MSNSKICMVMDATSDLGRAVALELARVSETVILVARDEGQGTRVQNEIVSVTQNPNLDLQLCDLGILSSVRNLGTIVSNRYERLDVLIHNVAIYTRHRETTVDGYERMFATNYLGPFLLTNMLLNPMRASGAARIVNVTAPVTHPLNFDDLQSERQFNSISAFNAARMAVLLSTFALARRLENSGVTVHAVHPGMIRSPLMKAAAWPLRLLMSLLASPSSGAAKDLVHLATEPAFASMHGKLLRHGKEIEVPVSARDLAAQERLWEFSEQLSELPLAKGEPPINDPHLSDAHAAR